MFDVHNSTASLHPECHAWCMPHKHKKDESESSHATRASVRREMAEPRVAKSARIAEQNLDTARFQEPPSITVPGTVNKIIPSPDASQAEKAQIAIEESDHRHGDFLIESTLTDENGDDVRLKKGAHVEVTIAAKNNDPQRTPAEIAVDNPMRYPVWQGQYRAAMLETNKTLKHTKVRAVQKAIHERMVGSKAEPEERQAIEDALNALKFLNR